MQKRSDFDEFFESRWPVPNDLKRYFLSPPDQRWRFASDSDCGGLSAIGVDGTEHLPEGEGRIDIYLTMVGNPLLGVLLQYRKAGGGFREAHYSQGDLSRLREWVRTKDGDAMPVGLYAPFEIAWRAVKEFIETDGALPKSIAWISERDLPKDSFPDPGATPHDEIAYRQRSIP